MTTGEDVTVLKCLEDLSRSIPPTLQQIQISDVQLNTDTQQKYIKGKVHTKWPLQITKGRQLMKVVLKSGNNSQDEQNVSVFLINDYAKKSDGIAKGDVMCLSDVYLEKSPSAAPGHHTCQVLVDKARTNARIWVVHCGTGVRQKTNSPPNQKTGQRTYNYTPLKDVKLGTTVNVYGVVRFFKPAFKTRRDYMMVLSITDPDLGSDQKLKCNLFARVPDELPKITNVGDIVRFHRLKVEEFNGALQGQNGPGFTWLVFEGHTSQTFDHKSSTTSYTLTDKEKEKVTELREWWGSDDGTVLSQQVPHEKCLSDICIDQYFDLSCQVVATCLLEPGVCMLLKVWDGTKPTVPIHEVDIRSEQKTAAYHKELMHIAQDYVVDVFVYDDHFNSAISVKPGDFVKFVNLHNMVQRQKHKDGQEHNAVPATELCLHRNTTFGRRLCRLDKNSHEVGLLRRRLDEISEQMREELSSEDLDLISVSVDAPPSSLRSDGVLEQSLLELSSSPLDAVSQDAEVQPIPGPSTMSKTNPKRSGRPLPAARPSKVGKKSLELIEDPVVESASARNSSTNRCMLHTGTVMTDHHHIQRTLVQDVLKHSAPYKFRIQAQILDYQPKANNAEEFLRLYCPRCNFLSSIPGSTLPTSPQGPSSEAPHSPDPPVPRRSHQSHGVDIYQCPKCSQTSEVDLTDDTSVNLDYIFILQFLLDDGTGWLLGQLWRKEAEVFFHGTSPEDLIKKKSAFEWVQQQLRFLCRQPGRSENKPWVEGCLKSYTTAHGTFYQLFDTELTLDES